MITGANKIFYTITIIDSSGCVIKDLQEVWLFDKPDVFAPTAFSPNADGFNDVFIPYYLNLIIYGNTLLFLTKFSPHYADDLQSRIKGILHYT